MATISPSQSEIERLIGETQRLTPPELDQFTQQVIRLRTRSITRSDESEPALVSRIRNWAPHDVLDRYRVLGAKQDQLEITEAEEAELLNLVDLVESLQVERMSNLAKLAELRGTTLQELLKVPEFSPRDLN